MASLHWMDQAACQGQLEVMFPLITDARGQARAKAICEDCPVREQCLDFGLAQDHQGRLEERWGIWGGLNGPQRGRLEARTKRLRRGRAGGRPGGLALRFPASTQTPHGESALQGVRGRAPLINSLSAGQGQPTQP